MDFPSAIEVEVPKSERRLRFEQSSDIRAWLESERAAWSKFNPAAFSDGGRIGNYLQEQINQLNGLSNLLAAFEQLKPEQGQEGRSLFDRINSHFNAVRNGLWVTTDSPLFPYVDEFFDIEPNLGGLIFLAARSDASSILGQFGQGFAMADFIKIVLRSDREAASNDWLLPQRHELQQLKNSFEKERDSTRADLRDLKDFTRQAREDEKTAVGARQKIWADLEEKIKGEWLALKKVYDEALALNAPATYWSGRAQTHLIQGICFGAAFSALLTVALCAFFKWGLPHLAISPAAGTQAPSVALLLVPVLVPAFGAVWVLRILGRLLGESLQLMRDAKERETMVKTFLAFAHDEERGRNLLLDQDRILILHALFRPSALVAVDDAPPVHWFDMLTNRIGDKKK